MVTQDGDNVTIPVLRHPSCVILHFAILQRETLQKR